MLENNEHYQQLPWCAAINDLVTKVNMMKLTLTSINNKIDKTRQIDSQRKDLNTEFTIHEVKEKLIKSNKNISIYFAFLGKHEKLFMIYLPIIL